MAASTHNQNHKDDDYKHETVVTRTPSFDIDVVGQLVVFGCGTFTQCIHASLNCVDYKNINEVQQCVEVNSIPPPPPLRLSLPPPPPPSLPLPLYPNGRHRNIHPTYIIDIAPPMEECALPNIIRQRWDSIQSLPPPSPSPAKALHDEKCIVLPAAEAIPKATSDSHSKLLPLPPCPFLKLMVSQSQSLEDEGEDDEAKQSEDAADRVQLYAVIRDITDMSNHNHEDKKVLLLTHHFVTTSYTILKCLEQRIFREDHDSDCRMSTTSNGSGHSSSSSSVATTTHNSFPSFHSFSNLSDVALSATLCGSNNILPNAPILSSFCIQAKVIEFIRFWMTEYWEEDWQKNAQLRACCKSFIKRYREHEKVHLTHNENANSMKLIDLLEETMKNNNCLKRTQSLKLCAILGDEIKCNFNDVVSPALPKLVLSNKSSSSYTSVRGGSKHREIPQDVTCVDSKSIAQQMTLSQHKLYCKIHPRECLNQAWRCSEKHTLAPNISEYIKMFNGITKWIQHTILSAKNVKHRGLTIKRWIKTEEYLYKMNNLMGVSAIRCALNSKEIFPLKDAWHFVERKHQKHMKQHKEIAKIYDRGNWKQLRQFENNCPDAIVPYFLMFATDMIGIESMNKKRVKNGTINFKALCVINKRINYHLQHQNKEYGDIESDATIQRWMNNEMREANKLGDDELYPKSKSVIICDKKELGNKSQI